MAYVKSYTKLSVSDRLAAGLLALNNAAGDAEITAALALRGYDAARMAQGRALHEQARALYDGVIGEHSDEVLAVGAKDEVWQALRDDQQVNLDVARAIFRRDRRVLRILGATGRRARDVHGWIAQAREFYIGAERHPEIGAALAEHGLTAEKRAAMTERLEGLEKAWEERIGQAVETDRARARRDEAMPRFDAWVLVFFDVARVALADKPGLLTKLGLRVGARRPSRAGQAVARHRPRHGRRLPEADAGDHGS